MSPRLAGLGLARRTVEVRGSKLQLLQHFFDTPVAQPRRFPRRADLTGMKVWPIAHRMIERMDATVLPHLRERASLYDRPLRVLELGAGTGIGGLGVALHLGSACDMVLTDPDLPVNFSEAEAGTSLEFLEANVALNREALDAAGARVVSMPLEWGNQGHIDNLRRTCLPAVKDEFDLVIGSELLYGSDNYESLLRVLSQLMTRDTVAVLGYTHRSGSEARFLQQAARRFEKVETEEFARSEIAAAWAMSTLSVPLQADLEVSKECATQTASPARPRTALSRPPSGVAQPAFARRGLALDARGTRLRRSLCTAASTPTGGDAPPPTADQVDMAIAPPLHLSPEEQLACAQEDDKQRGRRPLSLPPPNTAGEADYSSWGEYLLARGWADGNDLGDRLLVQSITGALSCTLTSHVACAHFGLDTKESLLVHIVGAAETNEGALLRSGWAWEELSALLPYTALHLAFVGPALADRPVERLTNQLVVECHSNDYVSWCDGRASLSATSAADLVLGFNSGCGTDQDSWRGTIERLLDARTPRESLPSPKRRSTRPCLVSGRTVWAFASRTLVSIVRSRMHLLR